MILERIKSRRIRNALRVFAFVLFVSLCVFSLLVCFTQTPNGQEPKAIEEPIYEAVYEDEIADISDEIIEADELIDEEVIEEIDPFEGCEEWAISFYDYCEGCCGKWYNPNATEVIGAMGVPLTYNYSVACPLPNGTLIEIEGMGVYEVQDKTAEWIAQKYEGKIADVFVASHDDIPSEGVLHRRVRVIEG